MTGLARMGLREAAELLGVSKHTLGNWVRKRRVPHYRIGPRIIYFNADDLQRWLESKKVEAAK